jgi:8-amino-3,8-dideoxy-alpha-D-manno-octulosonate transaminase
MPGYELFGEEEREAILQWFDSNNGVMMAHGFDHIRKGVFKVRDFEKEAAALLGAPYAQAVSSGSAALLVGLRALGVKPGDEIITQAFTFVATVEAIIEVGATPVITEVDESLNMDPDDLEKKITPRTKGIIPVHMHGAAADMKRILEIARKHNLWVLEDSAWVFGGTYEGKCLGTLGDVGTYSFDFAKNITTGEGGMVVTSSEELFKRARAYHDHGHEYNKQFPRGRDTRSQPGFNYRMTEIQGALGLTQLKKVDYLNTTQRQHKQIIKDGISGSGFEFRKIHNPEGDTSDAVIFFLENAAIAERFVARLTERGLGTKNLPDALTWHYAGTWRHLFEDFPALHNCETLWPQSDNLLRRAVSLPVTVRMTEADLDRVISSVREIAKTL